MALWIAAAVAAGVLALAAGAGAQDGYTDDGGVHQPAIEALAGEGILEDTECGEGRFCPDEPFLRRVMGVWLVRALDESPSAADTRFADLDPAVWWTPYVERLAELDVTQGCGAAPVRYCPAQPVTRGQMATFLTRAFDLEDGPPAGFTDTAGHRHAAAVDALAAARITAGCGEGRYCPDQPVTRGQMSTFLARALDLTARPNAPASDPAPTRELRFTAVSAGGEGNFWPFSGHTCGIHTDNTITCWGNNRHGQADAPTGQFTAITTGGSHSCGIHTNGSVTCWGNNEDGQTDAPTGQFTAITTGGSHSCGIHTNGSVTCWGNNWHGQADAPTGLFTAITAGSTHTCGIHTNGTVACWGDNSSGQATPPSTGGFTSITESCGIRTNETITCWINNRFDQTDTTGRFTAIATGWYTGINREYHSCGIRTDKTVTCWGYQWGDWLVPAYLPTGQFTAITTGEYHSCGIRTNETITCWIKGYGAIEAPTGQFTAITTRRFHSCGIRTNRAITCWGNNEHGQTDTPTGQFTAITAGYGHSCGIRTFGTLTCWGWNDYGQTEAPAGQFTTINVGNRHSCGIRTDKTVACWGDNEYKQTDTPAGQFTAISAGEYHSCGIRTNGTLACWGPNSYGQATPPTGQFAAVIAGFDHSCGIRTSGTLACWGSIRINT